MVPRYRRSLAGPIVLIVIGVMFLLRNMGLQFPMFRIFARGWPILLILWGVVKLVEHYQSQRDGGPPARVGAGGVFLLVILIIAGLSMSAFDQVKDHVNWGEVRDEFQMDDDVMRMFGGTFTYEQEAAQAVPEKSAVKIVCDRGSVSISNWNEKQIKVVAHKKIFAHDNNAANSVNQQSMPQITVTGSNVLVNANTQSSGNSAAVQADLEIFLPRDASVEIGTRRGDVMVSGRDGEVKVTTHRGDVTLDDVKGDVYVSLEGGSKGSVRATKIVGNVVLQGRIDDIDLTQVDGTVRLNGDFFGSMRLAGITKNVSIQTSRTTLEFAKLDGDLNLESDELRVNNVLGPVKLTTRSKEIHLDGISGDLRVENSNGGVEVHTSDAKPVGNIEINTQRGDVRLVLPSTSGFQVDAQTRRGDMRSDFEELQIKSDHGRSTMNGNVGKGGGRVQINSDNGDISIAKTT